MKVYLRASTESIGQHLTDCEFDEVPLVRAEMLKAGGVYYNGVFEKNLQHQFVLDDEEGAYAEIIVIIDEG